MSHAVTISLCPHQRGIDTNTPTEMAMCRVLMAEQTWRKLNGLELLPLVAA